MRQSLVNLNSSLFISEVLENVDMLLPFDSVNMGARVKKHLLNYKKDLLFHESALQTLVPLNIYSLLQQRTHKVGDMSEMANSSLYPGSNIKILTPQLQVPMQFDPVKFYLESVQKESLTNDDFFINFNSRS